MTFLSRVGLFRWAVWAFKSVDSWGQDRGHILFRQDMTAERVRALKTFWHISPPSFSHICHFDPVSGLRYARTHVYAKGASSKRVRRKGGGEKETCAAKVIPSSSSRFPRWREKFLLCHSGFSFLFLFFLCVGVTYGTAHMWKRKKKEGLDWISWPRRG